MLRLAQAGLRPGGRPRPAGRPAGSGGCPACRPAQAGWEAGGLRWVVGWEAGGLGRVAGWEAGQYWRGAGRGAGLGRAGGRPACLRLLLLLVVHPLGSSLGTISTILFIFSTPWWVFIRVDPEYAQGTGMK